MKLISQLKDGEKRGMQLDLQIDCVNQARFIFLRLTYECLNIQQVYVKGRWGQVGKRECHRTKFKSTLKEGLYTRDG